MSVISVLRFVLLHLLCLLPIWVGYSGMSLLFGATMYASLVFAITAGYHRYLAHKSFKTSRVFQFLLCFLGTLSLQRGCIWWAANHRAHHKLSDTPEDPHSPVQSGFWYSHMGWIFNQKNDKTRWGMAKDLAKFPELKFLNSYWMYIYFGWCAAVLILLGPQFLVWGCFIATVAVWHATFCVNSLLHVWGKQDYPTKDQSRNNPWLSFVVFGENWHNNHHFYSSSVRQGFRWYEIDITYYVLCILEKLHIIWDLRRPPSQVLEQRIS